MQTITFAAIKVLNMKKILLIAFVALLSLSAAAQNKVTGKDSTTFKGYLYNEKYNVYLVIDFYHNNVTVPNQEIYGEMAGYFGDRQDGRKWLFTDAKIISKDKAEIQITNDYGSEDLTASLTAIDDKNFKFRQEDGSTLKIARNRKWLKMPKELNFVKR